jgi:hypothetical protein
MASTTLEPGAVIGVEQLERGEIIATVGCILLVTSTLLAGYSSIFRGVIDQPESPSREIGIDNGWRVPCWRAS